LSAQSENTGGFVATTDESPGMAFTAVYQYTPGFHAAMAVIFLV